PQLLNKLQRLRHVIHRPVARLGLLENEARSQYQPVQLPHMLLFLLLQSDRIGTIHPISIVVGEPISVCRAVEAVANLERSEAPLPEPHTFIYRVVVNMPLQPGELLMNDRDDCFRRIQLSFSLRPPARIAPFRQAADMIEMSMRNYDALDALLPVSLHLLCTIRFAIDQQFCFAEPQKYRD